MNLARDFPGSISACGDSSTWALESNSAIVKPAIIMNYKEGDFQPKDLDSAYSMNVISGAPGTKDFKGNE